MLKSYSDFVFKDNINFYKLKINLFIVNLEYMISYDNFNDKH